MEDIILIALIIILFILLTYFIVWLINVYNMSPFTILKKSIYGRYLYFDNNGTTQPTAEVIEAVSKGMVMGNASGSYAKDAQSTILTLKQKLYEWSGCNEEDYQIILTSGASEANNLVIRGIVDASNQSQKIKKLQVRPHVILSSVEHKTSIECAKQLENENRIALTLLPVSIYGTVDPNSIIKYIRPETCLISIMHINNETGAVNDVQAIAKIANTHQIFFHTDAVQSFGKYSMNMFQWGIDSMSMTFHKMYGPVGIGALVIRRSISKDSDHFVPQIAGTQNDKLRGGTENMGAINGALKAMEIAHSNRYEKNKKLLEMKNYIIGRLKEKYNIGLFANYAGKDDKYIPFNPDTSKKEVVFFGPVDNNGLPLVDKTSPNTILFTTIKYTNLKDPYSNFCNIKLKRELEEQNIIVSMGAACSTNLSEPNYILVAMSAPFICRCGNIRISLGDFNTMCECKKMCDILIKLIDSQ